MGSLVRSILGISRAPFLLLPIVLVGVGAGASAYDAGLAAGFSWTRTLLALVGLIAAHVGVNVLNEASDMRTGIDLRTERTPFSGGSGTLPSGAMSVAGAYAWGFIAVAVAVGIGAYFLSEVGTGMLWILLVGLAAIMLYTDFLARLGVGEVFAGLGLGALPVLGTSFVQDTVIGGASVAASVPAFFMTFNLLLLNEFPDAEADRSGGRRHLVILFGRPAAAKVYVLAVVAVPVSIAVAVVAGYLPWPALVACLPTLLCVPGLRWAVSAPEGPVPIPAQGGNVIWNLVTNAVLAVVLFAAAST
jgi:1,4-dihydroxy-2-naphthoate octaprenyltransferase